MSFRQIVKDQISTPLSDSLQHNDFLSRSPCRVPRHSNWRNIPVTLIDPCQGGLSAKACLRQLMLSALECMTMQIPGALPKFLRVWWVSASPFAFLFAG